MANDLSNLMPKILARALIVLREKCMMPLLVNGDYGNEAKEKGDTIDVPISAAVAATPVVPGYLPIAPTDVVPKKVQVPLNNWYQNQPFALTDAELMKIDVNGQFIPMQMAEAIKGLARQVNQSIWAEYKGVYGITGTAGVTPFASAVTAATQARMVLNQQLCPKGQRRGVLDHIGEANMLALPQFSDAEKVATDIIKIEGEVGRKFGIDWYSDDDVPFHTKGATTGTNITNTGAPAAADTTYGPGGTVATAGLTAVPVPGDVFTVAGDTQTYVVVSHTGGTPAGTTTFLPPAKVAWTNGSVFTFVNSHRVNLVFHREAIAFATRPLMDATEQFNNIGSKMMTLTDDKTGLVLRLEVGRQHKQVAWEFDLLWGVRLVRPAMAVRILG